MVLFLAVGAGAGSAPAGQSWSVVGSDPAAMVATSPPLAAPAGIAPPATGTSADAARSMRVIVRLRDQSGQGSVSALSLPGGLAVPSSTPETRLQTLLAKHAVRSAAPLSPAHVRARQQQAAGAGSGAKAAATPTRFPARAARAPANATPPDLSTTYVLDLGKRSTRDVAATIQSLRADPAVLYAEEDKVARAFYVPNDPSYSSTGSWGQAYDDLYGLKKIGTTAAWDVTRGQGVVVAVIDTGIDYNHPDISANVWINAGEIPGNGIDDDNNGFIDDVRGWDFVGINQAAPQDDNDPMDGHYHGTHVAGTIAATGDNGLGVVGVAWQAKVMALKGLDDAGLGYDSGLARAIIYAADNGADIINASWGGGGSSQAIDDAIAYAHSHGVVFVAAAGNSHADVSNFYPANLPAAIAVSALAPDETLAGFSNFGSKIDVSAPGQDILSLKNDAAGYHRLNGTSMAAPHASGVVALILAHHPSFSVEQVRQVLRASATDLGPAGRDDSFGYGRVNAAQALNVDEVLSARILSPADRAAVAEPVVITGAAAGAGFDHFVLEYGAGAAPTAWTTLTDSASSVENGALGALDVATIPNGIYSVRLRVFTAGGLVFSDQIQLTASYSGISSPVTPPVPTLSLEFKPGGTLQVGGSARAAGFQSFKLEWAPGLNALSGWSSQGITLAGDGLAPVVGGVLGNWLTTPGQDGYLTLRLTVTAAGFSSVATTSVYAQASLHAGNWPRLAGHMDFRADVRPVRQPDGTSRLLLCDQVTGDLHYFAPDGSEATQPLNWGNMRPPAVADMDGQPGEEIVVPDGPSLKILASDLTLIRTISTGEDMLHGYDPVVLSDLDGDGTPEIIAPSRVFSEPVWWPTVKLRVFRADGTPYSAHYPLTIATTDVYFNLGINLVPVDLDQDGTKEIVLAWQNPNGSDYTLKAIKADGTPYGAWSEVVIAGHSLFTMAAADLDHDGLAELILSEKHIADGRNAIRVVDSTGVTRPGWPVVLSWPYLGPAEVALADLDGDQHNEIVAFSSPTIDVLKADGSAWGSSWTTGGSSFGNLNLSMVIADIDGDGRPEIIAPVPQVGGAGMNTTPYNALALTAYGSLGQAKRTWELLGLADRQPFIATPLVGDFDGDGKADLTANISLVDRQDGATLTSGITLLTTGSMMDPAGAHWSGRYGDVRNSRTRPMPLLVAPGITSHPAGSAVAAGLTASFMVEASGAPLNYQWRRNGSNLGEGGNLSGVKSATLTITGAQAGNAGTYDVVVSNAAGSAISNPATLVVTANFADWRQAKFTPGELLDPNISGPNADPDHDGFGNLLEYALGFEPKTASTTGLPEVGTAGSDWVCTYSQPEDRTDVTCTVEVSFDLVSWTANGVSRELVSNTGGLDHWRARYPLAGVPKIFFRLRVTRP